MLQHLRANLWLLLLTLILAAVLYPLLLLALGQTLFPHQAEGSLIFDRQGQPIGSRLIAQPFTDNAPQYFQPRPSAASYNAAASGASNWGAANPLLRDRVARQLGPIVKYGGARKGQPVGPDIEKWFQEQPLGFVARWARDHPALAEQWVKDNVEVVAGWLGRDRDALKADSANAARDFFKSYAERHPATWPSVEGQTRKRIKPLRAGTDIQAYFFELWLQNHKDVELEQVPGDMVTSSGSGLDPHITLKNALYQLDRVAAAWAKKTKDDEAKVRKEIEKLLNDKAEAPLGGSVGDKLVNVLEANLALRDRYGQRADADK